MLGGIGLGTLLTVNLIWLPGAIREIRESQMELQRVAVRSLQDKLQLFLEDKVQALRRQAMVFRSPLLDADHKALPLLAHRFLQREQAFEEIGILDQQGQERVRLSRKLAITDRDLADRSDAKLFQEGRQQAVYWGPVVTTETSEPSVALAVPLQRSEATVAGVVFGVVNLKSLWNVTAEFQLGHGGRAYVVDETGRLIAAEDSSLVLKELSFADRPLIRRLDRGVISFAQGAYANEHNVSVMATALPLLRPPWTVVVEQPQSLLYAPIWDKLRFFGSLSLIGLVTCFSLAHFLSRRFAGPITRLREGVERIGSGHLEHRVTVETGDEIGNLARQFNQMAQAVQTRDAEAKQAREEIQRQLESLHLLITAAQKMVAGRDLNTLAQEVLQTVSTAFGIRLAWIGCAEPDGVVRPLYWAGEVAEYLKRVQVRWDDSPLGGGPAGRAIREGHPVVMDIAHDPAFPLWREPALEQGFREVAAFPLMRGQKPFGHLILYSDEAGFFTQERVDLLQSYTHIAAAALENARLLQETELRAQEQEALNAIAMATSRWRHLEELLQAALDKVLEVSGRERGYIRLKDTVTGQIRLAAHRGISPDFIEALFHRRTPGGKSDQVFHSGEPLVINDVQGALVKEELLRQGDSASAWIPLKAGDTVLGLLNVSTAKPVPFAPREVDLLRAIGNVIGVAIENSQLYEEIKKQTVELERSNKVKDEFLSVMSHELRTPLTASLGYAGMVQDGIFGQINPEQAKALGVIVQQTEELLTMINSILVATKIEAERVAAESHTVDLGDFLDELKSVYDVPLDKEIALIWDYPSDLPPIRADSGKLKHILQNLIHNAIKFTDKGRVTVSARAKEGSRQ